MYVLLIDGFEIKHEDYNELKTIAENHVSLYEIYEIRGSAMNDPKFFPSRFTEKQVDQMIREVSRGHTLLSLTKKYMVSSGTISHAINNRKIIEQSLDNH